MSTNSIFTLATDVHYSFVPPATQWWSIHKCLVFYLCIENNMSV